MLSAFVFGLLLGMGLALLLVRARRADGGELLGCFEREMRALEAERHKLRGEIGAKIDAFG
jgi:hypothetical protein